MATPTLTRSAWFGAALLAAVAIVALALHGRRPDPGLVRFEAAGVMLHIAPERVREVRVEIGDRRYEFARIREGGWTSTGSAGVPGDWAGRIDTGLRFLHASAPQRVMTGEEFAATPAVEFGLDPPRYTVSVRAEGLAPFVVQFGGPNAQGLAQYARIDGRNELFLLPRFVGAEWEAAIGTR